MNGKRLRAVIAALALLLGLCLAGGSPVGAQILTSSHSVSVPDVSGTESGGGPGECAWTYQWYVSTSAGYTWVKWLVNPCGYSIQCKAEFTDITEGHYWNYSGVVKAIGLEDKAGANSALDAIDIAQRHIFYPTPGTWGTWRQYWSG